MRLWRLGLGASMLALAVGCYGQPEGYWTPCDAPASSPIQTRVRGGVTECFCPPDRSCGYMVGDASVGDAAVADVATASDAR